MFSIQSQFRVALPVAFCQSLSAIMIPHGCVKSRDRVRILVLLFLWFILSPVKNRTGVATEVLFHAVSHWRSVNVTSKYNRNHTGAISHRCSVNGAKSSNVRSQPEEWWDEAQNIERLTRGGGEAEN